MNTPDIVKLTDIIGYIRDIDSLKNKFGFHEDGAIVRLAKAFMDHAPIARKRRHIVYPSDIIYAVITDDIDSLVEMMSIIPYARAEKIFGLIFIQLFDYKYVNILWLDHKGSQYGMLHEVLCIVSSLSVVFGFKKTSIQWNIYLYKHAIEIGSKQIAQWIYSHYNKINNIVAHGVDNFKMLMDAPYVNHDSVYIGREYDYDENDVMDFIRQNSNLAPVANDVVCLLQKKENVDEACSLLIQNGRKHINLRETVPSPEIMLENPQVSFRLTLGGRAGAERYDKMMQQQRSLGVHGDEQKMLYRAMNGPIGGSIRMAIKKNRLDLAQIILDRMFIRIKNHGNEHLYGGICYIMGDGGVRRIDVDIRIIDTIVVCMKCCDKKCSNIIDIILDRVKEFIKVAFNVTYDFDLYIGPRKYIHKKYSLQYLVKKHKIAATQWIGNVPCDRHSAIRCYDMTLGYIDQILNCRTIDTRTKASILSKYGYGYTPPPIRGVLKYCLPVSVYYTHKQV